MKRWKLGLDAGQVLLELFQQRQTIAKLIKSFWRSTESVITMQKKRHLLVDNSWSLVESTAHTQLYKCKLIYGHLAMANLNVAPVGNNHVILKTTGCFDFFLPYYFTKNI